MKVLLIEDDADIVELLSACIGSRWPQANITAVAEGREGLLVAETEAPDLVVLDIGLPDIDGYEVLGQLRAFSDVPVVMLTGRDSQADIATFLQEGALADDYIIKPVSLTDLVRRIEAVIRTPGGPTYPAAENENHGRRQAGEEQYEGSVRLRVTTNGGLGQLVNLVRQMHRSPDLRLLRMVKDPDGVVELRLGIRQPIPLRIVMCDMDGVVDVTPSPGRRHEPLVLTLGAALGPASAG